MGASVFLGEITALDAHLSPPAPSEANRLVSPSPFDSITSDLLCFPLINIQLTRLTLRGGQARKVLGCEFCPFCALLPPSSGPGFPGSWSARCSVAGSQSAPGVKGSWGGRNRDLGHLPGHPSPFHESPAGLPDLLLEVYSPLAVHDTRGGRRRQDLAP